MERAADESTSPSSSSAPNVPNRVMPKPVNSILKSGLVKIKRKRFSSIFGVVLIHAVCVYIVNQMITVATLVLLVTRNSGHKV